MNDLVQQVREGPSAEKKAVNFRGLPGEKINFRKLELWVKMEKIMDNWLRLHVYFRLYVHARDNIYITPPIQVHTCSCPHGLFRGAS